MLLCSSIRSQWASKEATHVLKGYPTVGMCTPDEEVLANFGCNSFRTNVEMLRAEAAKKVLNTIERTQLDSKGKCAWQLPHVLLEDAEGSVTCQSLT